MELLWKFNEFVSSTENPVLYFPYFIQSSNSSRSKYYYPSLHVRKLRPRGLISLVKVSKWDSWDSNPDRLIDQYNTQYHLQPLLQVNHYSRLSSSIPLQWKPLLTPKGRTVLSFVPLLSLCKCVPEPLLDLETLFIYCLLPPKTVNHLGKNQVLNIVPRSSASTQWALNTFLVSGWIKRCKHQKMTLRHHNTLNCGLSIC